MNKLLHGQSFPQGGQQGLGRRRAEQVTLQSGMRFTRLASTDIAETAAKVCSVGSAAVRCKNLTQATRPPCVRTACLQPQRSKPSQVGRHTDDYVHDLALWHLRGYHHHGCCAGTPVWHMYVCQPRKPT